MRFAQVIVFACLIVTGAVRAGATAPGQPEPAPATTVPLKVQRQLVRGQAEVNQLKQHVHQQETDSQRASRRLEQQDREIAKLQEQLQKLQSSPSAGQH